MSILPRLLYLLCERGKGRFGQKGRPIKSELTVKGRGEDRQSLYEPEEGGLRRKQPS